jgi:two-component system cell cycle response regulator DivK
LSGVGQGRLILIVEDNEKNLKLVRDVLRFHGFETLEARDSESGVALAREHAPDVILMDIALPGMDGIGATAVLKSDPPTSGIPIVALTASVMQADRMRFQGAGFAGVIAKPIDVLKFSEQVLAYCRR